MKPKNLVIGIAILMFIFQIQLAFAETSGGLVVDYDLTRVSNDLYPGSTGTLLIILKNTGSFNIENIEANIPDFQGIHAGGYWKLGVLAPGQSITIKTTIKVSNDVYIGTHTITLFLKYKGYWTTYETDNGMLKTKLNYDTFKTNWQIPITVKSNPYFTIKTENNIFYKDIEENLRLKLTSKENVRDVSLQLSSNCVKIIGSAEKYVGILNANEEHVISFEIKPVNAGECNIDATINYLDNSGRASKNLSFGITVFNPYIDFEIDSNLTNLNPGETKNIKIKAKNLGKIDAENVKISIDLSDPFIPIQNPDFYFENIKSNETMEIVFLMSINQNAETKTYKIPVRIKYSIGNSEYNETKSIGANIVGYVNLEIISVSIIGDKLRIEIANTGTRTANAVKATLISENYKETTYKDAINPNKGGTFSFEITKENKGKLILEYTGTNNERIKIEENITLPTATIPYSSEQKPEEFLWWIVTIIIVVIFAVLIYKFREKF